MLDRSSRSTVRMTGAANGAVLKLLANLGAVCSEYQRLTLLLSLSPCRSQAWQTVSFPLPLLHDLREPHYGWGLAVQMFSLGLSVASKLPGRSRIRLAP